MGKIVDGSGTLRFSPPEGVPLNGEMGMTESTEQAKDEKKEKRPPWYTSVDWLTAKVDLTDGKWGSITIEEPSGEKADEYWDTVRPVAGKDQTDISAQAISDIAIAQLSIYVSGGTDERIPKNRYDRKAWKTAYGKMPKRVAQRIIDGIEIFVGGGDEEGNSSGGNSEP